MLDLDWGILKELSANNRLSRAKNAADNQLSPAKNAADSQPHNFQKKKSAMS